MKPRRPRNSVILFSLCAFSLILFVCSIGMGDFRIHPMDVIKVVMGQGTKQQAFVINTLRLPRALTGFGVGIGLAISGAILQGVTRNVLASPGIIGLNAGAGLAAVLIIVLMPSIPLSLLPVGAFTGACIAGFVSYLFAWKQGSDPIRLVLVGMGIAAIAQAGIQFAMTFGNITQVTQASIWMTGSLYGRSWEHFVPMLPWLFCFVVFALSQARHLDVLQLGDDIAKGVGSRIEMHRSFLLLISIALAGISVSAAGLISFVGLMSPHIARKLVGPTHSILLPVSALVGGCTVLLADLLGRTLFAPVEIPCGVVTAVVGAPYLLHLLLYKQRVQSA